MGLLSDAGIGNDVVEMIDTTLVGGRLLDGVKVKFLDAGIILDHDDTAALACG